jgi:metal-dependent amidase/aminoacylase/carboxypeptidase family protein
MMTSLRLRLLYASLVLAVSTPALALVTPIPDPPASSALIDIYKSIHAHPELSHFEARTSAIVAQQLRAAGYEVTDHVGVYPDGSRAYGVVGVLKNGAGPTLLIRADMDALPIVPAMFGLRTYPARRWASCTPAAMMCIPPS